MRQLIAFTKKEFTEYIRTGKLWIMLIIFFMFGIMNPAIAKLTPWLYEVMSESMEEQGIVIASVQVDALTSWMQFYKNIFMAVLVLAVMLSGILTSEYQKGTLINMLTKGLARWKVIAAKSIAAMIVWSVCYWLCFGVTYGYNAYFWDNRTASYVGAGAGCIYLFGIFVIALLMLSSAVLRSSFSVLLMTGGVLIAAYLASLVPAISEYNPIRLMSAGNIVYSGGKPEEFIGAAIVTAILCVAGFMAAIFCFDKKKL